MFLLQKNGRTKTSGNSLFRNTEGQLMVWHSEDAAIEFAESKKSSWEEWRVRKANSTDFASIGIQQKKKWHLTTYIIVDEKRTEMAKKTTSSGCLVDLFEDSEKRKYAISSKANNEQEFITEASQVLSASPCADWNIRLREMLPLIVDMCCKYRGYKAETVQERRELVAGDLEMPSRA
jgi:hypothetical protein